MLVRHITCCKLLLNWRLPAADTCGMRALKMAYHVASATTAMTICTSVIAAVLRVVPCRCMPSGSS